MSNTTSFSSIVLGSGLVTASGNNLYLNGLSISGNVPVDIVRTTGDQTINGIKQFNNLLNGPTGYFGDNDPNGIFSLDLATGSFNYYGYPQIDIGKSHIYKNNIKVIDWSGFTVRVNETTNKLDFVVKYSNNAVKSGSINLA